jgi:hypothetical protein
LASLRSALIGGKTPADFTKAVRTWGSQLRMPSWADELDEPGAGRPRASDRAGPCIGLAKGRHMFVTVDFEPGRYVMLCYIPDAKDGKPHSDHGMIKEIEVQ